MNKEYNCIGGDIIVKNEEGSERKLNYQDNIDEILIKENVIEEIKKQINACNYALGVQETTKKLKYNRKKYVLNILLPITMVPTIFMCLNAGATLTIIGLVIALLQGGALTLGDVLESKQTEKYINALKVTINRNKKLLEDQNKKLDELKKDNTKDSANKQNNEKQFKLKNEDEMFHLSKLQQLYYITGYDIKYLYELEKKGLLNRVLHDEYNSEEILIMSDIIKEEGPVLVKSKRKNSS